MAHGLAMTARMRETLRVLRMSQTDLERFIAAQVDGNPLLERFDPPAYAREGPARAEAGGLDDATLRVPAGPMTIRERLLRQMMRAMPDGADRRIGATLIDELDAAGRLAADRAELARRLNVTPERIEAVRQRLMRFDPVGVAAMSLAECFAVQLQARNRFDPAMAALLANLDLLARGERSRLRAACGVDADDLAEMIAELRALNPRPWAEDVAEPVQTRIPDLMVQEGPNGTWRVAAAQDLSETVGLNTALTDRLGSLRHEDERKRVAGWLSGARWLVHALARRQHSLMVVGEHILFRQADFMTRGPEALRPLTMRRIADDVRLHDSTISRIVANKHIATPFGLFPLKFFFSAGVEGTDSELRAAGAARAHIRRLIHEESPDAVLSDARIVQALHQIGFALSRRTVVKYREVLGIGSSFERRKTYRAADHRRTGRVSPDPGKDRGPRIPSHS
nr:RNA polymerase factor sigma-54 [Gluconacetobacter johannae]